MLKLQSTQLSVFYECDRKWYNQFVLKRCKPPNAAMQLGSTFHLIFERYFKYGQELIEIPAWIMENNPDYIPHLPTAMLAFEGYLKYGKPKNFASYQGMPAIELEFNLQLDDDLLVRGKIDYIQEIGTKKYVTDIKTTSMTLTDYFFSNFELGVQPMLYSYVSQAYFEDIEGFMIDGVCMKTTKDGTYKADNYRNQFFPLLPNREQFINEVYRIGHFIIDNQDNPDAFLHRYSSCTTKYGKCQYFDVCRRKEERQMDILMSDDFVDYVGNYAD